MRQRALLVMIVFMAISLPVVASSITRKNMGKLIDETRLELENRKNEAENTRAVLAQKQSELDRIQANLDRITIKLRSAETKEVATRKQLNKAEDELLSLAEQLDQRRSLLGRRVLILYKYGPLCYFKIILKAGSFGELVNRYEMACYLIRHDLDLLSGYRNVMRKVTAKREELAARHRELAANRRNYDSLRAAEAQARETAAKTVQRTQDVLASAQQNVDELEAALDEYEQLSKALGSEMQRKTSNISLGTGRMRWPVSGRLSSGFGWRMHPKLRVRKFHNGQDIAVPTGTTVSAADSGIVSIAGFRGGYGYLVVIDHGRGLSTCYGHNSVLLAHEGDAVVKGRRIAFSGNTGLSTGPHLHFEVRINGTPVNPLPYLRGER